MGTRSTVKFHNDFGSQEDIICSLYAQYDGYPEGVGFELAKFLKGKKIVNGFGPSQDDGNHANGAGCLAAQYVQYAKNGIGGVYMVGPNDTQEYDYSIKIRDGKILIRLTNFGEVLFNGGVDKFYEYCAGRVEVLNNM